MIVWDASRVEAGLAAISPIRAPLLVHVKELLDGYHRIQRPLEYYDVLLGDWVEQFLHLVHFALSEISEQAIDPPTAEELVVAISADSVSFTLRVVEDPSLTETFRHLVNSLVMGEGLPRIAIEDIPVHTAAKGIKASALAAIGGLASPKKPEILICAPYMKCSKVEWLSALMHWRKRVRWDDLAYSIHWDAKSDRQWRISNAGNCVSSGDSLEIAKALCSLYIPRVLLEGFDTYRRQVLGLGLFRPKAVYSANALSWHTSFKILVAEWREQGTLLLYHQHGGGYGVDRQNVLEDHEIRVSDRFYTWGWRLPSSKVRPLSPPPLSGKYSGCATPKWHVLLVCSETPKIAYRLWYQPMPGTMEMVIRDTAEFVSRLGNPAALMVRLAPKRFGWEMQEAIAQRSPSTRFDDFSVGSMTRFAESRLVVHNYLGTSWLETLALDIPTVCFYSPVIQAFRPEVVPFIIGLEEVGILHRSGSAAAGFVQSLGSGVDAWWRSEEAQTARQAFVANYANFSSNWVAEWEAEFDSLPQV